MVRYICLHLFVVRSLLILVKLNYYSLPHKCFHRLQFFDIKDKAKFQGLSSCPLIRTIKMLLHELDNPSLVSQDIAL
jgi:hypothetical protein